MLTHFNTVRSSAILSVRCVPSSRRLVLVITPSPHVARVVSDYLRETDKSLTVVWMPTVAAACSRLEWEHTSTIVIDDAIPESDNAIQALHLAYPKAEVQVMVGGV
jgi:CheY-like chemotaxis protein